MELYDKMLTHVWAMLLF